MRRSVIARANRAGQINGILGARIVADVPLSIRVASQDVAAPRQPEIEAVSARPYRKVFASYSHKDLAVVQEFEQYAEALGDEYYRDSVSLRAGEVWSTSAGRDDRRGGYLSIFWSSNSMRSRFVRQEWEHALSLQRGNFIRPVYWETPLPDDIAHDLPPASLSRIHFQLLARDKQSEMTKVNLPDNMPMSMPVRKGDAPQAVVEAEEEGEAALMPKGRERSRFPDRGRDNGGSPGMQRATARIHNTTTKSTGTH